MQNAGGRRDSPAGGTVDALSEQVEVADVTGGLLERSIGESDIDGWRP